MRDVHMVCVCAVKQRQEVIRNVTIFTPPKSGYCVWKKRVPHDRERERGGVYGVIFLLREEFLSTSEASVHTIISGWDLSVCRRSRYTPTFVRAIGRFVRLLDKLLFIVFINKA